MDDYDVKLILRSLSRIARANMTILSQLQLDTQELERELDLTDKECRERIVEERPPIQDVNVTPLTGDKPKGVSINAPSGNLGIGR